MGYTPQVLVIGGGAVGTGVARDLAIRGLEVTLVERGTLANGTSGSMHALLHSGARYADEDPEVAAACHRENEILHSIGDHLISDTGGLFASLPADPDGFVETKRDACEAVGIPAEELSGAAAREREPRLAADAERAIAVPDAVVDPFRLCVANAVDAARHGARIRTGTQVTDLRTADGTIDGVGIKEVDPTQGYPAYSAIDTLDPDYVVNAAGPWAGDIADTADLSVPIRHSQGAMLVVDRAGLETVLHRCRPRTEGDIAVPFGGSAVLGATDRPAEGPDAVERTADAVDHLVEELAALVPDVAGARPYRAYWGVRALPPAERARTATLVDHADTDGHWGMVSVFGGKLTTHRATAERVADHVCEAFGIDRPSRTADLELPEVPTGRPEPGDRSDPLLCRANDVRRSAVRAALDHDVAAEGVDLRPVTRLTRAGMGTCQGGACAHRLALALFEDNSYRDVDRAIGAYAEDRWAGRRLALWGEGFAGAMATYDRHVRLLDRGGRPAEGIGTLDWAAYDAGRADHVGGGSDA